MSSAHSPVRELFNNELQIRLNEALGKLSIDNRMIVILADIQEMPSKEIGEILGISDGTVRSRLFYAHRKLQEMLGDLRGGDPC